MCVYRQNIKTLLWLDDCRDPFDQEIDWLVFSPIGRNVDVVWVKSYDEFVTYIKANGLPDGICFDHDLGKLTEIEVLKQGYSKSEARKLKQEEKSGYDCVNWLIDYCLDNNLVFPPCGFQSANPVGRENMMKKIENFRKTQNK